MSKGRAGPRGGGSRGDGSRGSEPHGGDAGGGDFRGGDPVPLGEVLGAFLRKHGLEREVEGQSALERWPQVVGEKIAEVARPRALARGVLYVEVRSSAWVTELSMIRHEILARLNAGLEKGRIERIVFRLAEDPDAPDEG